MEKLAEIEEKIAVLERSNKMNLDSNENTIKINVMGIKIGDFVMVSSPAEVLVEIGLNIKSMSPYRKTFVIFPSDGYICYGPPESYYDKDGYEVTDCILGPGWQKLYEEKAAEIIRKL